MRIKKDSGTKNEWILADGLWIRNYTKLDSHPININKYLNQDYQLLVQNSIRNNTLNYANISDEKFFVKNVVIISDGYQFQQRHHLLSHIDDVAVIAVNRALKKWDLMSEKNPKRKSINAYIVNNPYEECLQYLPNKYFPTCIASSRTNHQFVNNYKGSVYLYDPSPDIMFGQPHVRNYYIDDYRNPICAAIILAYRMGAEKLMLMCCDDSFENPRSGALELSNGLWTYPQQLLGHSIIDANLYWLLNQKEKEVKIADYSNGAKYKNATYINSEEDVINFFKADNA